MTTCERCEREGAQLHSLLVDLDGGPQLAQFYLCDKCYDYGVDLEPLEDIQGFLHVDDMPEPWGPAS